MTQAQEHWRQVWREQIVPLLSRDHLQALAHGLNIDDPCIMQFATTFPLHGASVRKACPLCYMAWRGDNTSSTQKVYAFYRQITLRTDFLSRHFVNWIDTTPRSEWRHDLLEEVNLALAGREENAPS